MTCRTPTPPRLRLLLCDDWDVVLDPTRARLRARHVAPGSRWLVCHVDGVRLHRDADGSASLAADRLLLSVDGGAIEDSAETLAAVEDLLATLHALLRGDGRVDAEPLPIRTVRARRTRACA